MNTNNTKDTKIFKFKLNIKILLSHLFGIAVLLTFTNYVISYSKSEFELPFYDRTKNSPAQISYDTGLLGREDITAEEEKAAEDATSVENKNKINPDDFIVSAQSQTEQNQNYENTEPTEPAYDFEIFSDDMSRRGFSVSDGVYEIYSEAKTNAEINRYKTEVSRILTEYAKSIENENGGGDPPVLPDAPLLYEYKFAQIEPDIAIDMPVSQSMASSYLYKQAVEPIMDYIIIRTKDKEILCDASGNIISRDFESLGVEILKMRDKDGRTVFKHTDGSYFIYDPDYYAKNPTEDRKTGGGFVLINFSEIATGDRGAPFMYPSYYGADGANGLDRYYNPSYLKKWCYVDAGTINTRIPRNYDNAFNFSENVGIAYQESSGRGYKLFFLDENGYNFITNYNYYAPDEIKKDHLGFFYFDHGLTRVYEREFDRRGFEIAERELMVDYYGTQFYIPEDYTVKAYSNGMILLEKNGLYGFMNYLGEWIVNPIFTYAQPFYEGVAVIGLANGKKALIDTQFNLIANFKYNAITNCTGGVVALYEKNVGWTILNKVRRQIEVG